MRIISGSFKGKKLNAPVGFETRPTSDRAKESVFNILQSYVKWENSIVMDIFAGSGALGIEALSRGAMKCVFVEKNSEAKKSIKRNLDTINKQDSVLISDFNLLQKSNDSFDVIFMDPPYNQNLIPLALEKLLQINMISEKTTIVAECEKNENPDIPEQLSIKDSRIYGKAKVLFIKLS